MKITRTDGLYIAQCSFEERVIPRKAGFTFDKELKKWITASDEIASKLEEYCVAGAKERLDNIVALKNELLKESYAPDSDNDYPCPEGEKYLPFQKGGIAYALPRKHTLLADPPGLGKTIQFIGVSNSLPDAKRILIVVPAFLKLNWRREWLKWDIKGLTVGFAESAKERVPNSDPARYHAKKCWPSTDVVIISYAVLKDYKKELDSVEWDLIGCDESHNLNNEKTLRTQQVIGGGRGKKQVAALRYKKMIWLTGTPILSRIYNLWAACHLMDPDGLGKNWVKFVRRYCDAKETHFGWDLTGSSNLDELNEFIRLSFMIRRPKSILGLKGKQRQIIELPAEGKKRVVKKELQVFEDNLTRLEEFNTGVKQDFTELSKEETKELVKNLSICNWDREELLKLAESEKAQFEAMSAIREEVALAKLPMCVEHIKNLMESGEKIVVFAVHKSVVAELRKHLPNFVVIVGGTPHKKRQEAVDALQTDPDCPGLLGNFDAAGVGYTMTAATIVVCVEVHWSAPIIEQAEDRVDRIGQDSYVLVQHLVLEGSLDGYLLQALMELQEEINEALGDNANPFN